MSDIVRPAVLLISGRRRSNFGTGFIVHRDQHGTYFVTCAHVVHNVGGADEMVVDNNSDLHPVLVDSGVDRGVDLAVLRVAGLFERPVLRLADDGASKRVVTITGFRKHTSSEHVLRSIRGTMGSLIDLQAHGKVSRVDAWDLSIEGEYYLAEGYSGAPVLDASSRQVIGVASHLEHEGRKGQAISIAALRVAWIDLPRGLIAPGSHLPEAANTATESMTAEPRNTASPAQFSGGITIQRSTVNGDPTVGTVCKTINYYGGQQSSLSASTLAAVFSTLRQAISDLTPDLRAKAQQRVDLLEEATSAEALDLAMMESVVMWFRAHCPALFGQVRTIIYHPIVTQRITEAGATRMFQQRFRHFDSEEETTP